MKKIIALTLAAVFAVLSVFTLCVSAAGEGETEKTAYTMTMTGPTTMVDNEEGVFTLSIDGINAFSGGLRKVEIVLTYSNKDFQFQHQSVEWMTPQSWKRRFSTVDENEITELRLETYYDKEVTPVTASGAIKIKIKMKITTAENTATISVKTLAGKAANSSFGEVKGVGNGITVKRADGRAEKPASAPELLSKGETSVMLKKSNTEVLEYSCDLVEWRKTVVFDGLVKNGVYTFYSRVPAKDNIAASEPSDGLVVKLGDGSAGAKNESAKPPIEDPTPNPNPQYKPEIALVTETSIYVKSVSGYEYNLSGSGAWSTVGAFTGLQPGTTYWLFWRKTGTAASEMMPVSTLNKAQQKAPAPVAKTVTQTTVELVAVTGCEYSRDMKTWQDSPLFTELEEGKVYLFYQRYKATSTASAGETSDYLWVTTKKTCTHANVTTSEKAATCTEEGYVIKKCNDCGEVVYRETIGVKGHDWEWKETAATCTTSGSKGYVCRNCGTTKDMTTIPAKGHTPGAAATCTTPQVCTVCGAAIASAKGHTPGAAATCTTPQVCTVCGEVIVPAKGHVPGGEATCTNPQKCLVCGEVIVPAKGHKEGAPVVESEPTKSQEGSQVIKCTVCGEVIRREAIPKLKGSGTVLTVVIILAIVAVIAAGVAVFVILSNNNGQGSGKGKGGRASIGSQR